MSKHALLLACAILLSWSVMACGDDEPSGGPCDEAACAPEATCAEVGGAAVCTCPSDMIDPAGDGKTCQSLGECAPATNPCDPLATCTPDASGAATCECPSDTVDENGDGTSCVTEEPCDGLCDPLATCTAAGTCECPAGYDGDGTSCTDLDECTAGTDNCDANATCTNSAGSFGCACNEGYEGDGTTCTATDPCAANPCPGGEACAPTNDGHACVALSCPDAATCVHGAGLYIEILEVAGGSGTDGRLAVGDVPVITYQLFDEDGVPYYPGEVDELFFAASGPSTHMAPVLPPTASGDVVSGSFPIATGDTDPNRAIAWRYEASAIPAVFAAPANDTDDLGPADGDRQGQALPDGTYAFTVWGNLLRTDARNRSVLEGGSDVEWRLLGTSTELERRERVLSANCSNCHGSRIFAHEGSVVGEVDVCLTCHVQGAEDFYSDVDGSVTPGRTIYMPWLIHSIHSASALSQPLHFINQPIDAGLPGYPNYNELDYSTSIFPARPAGVAQCRACHDGAAQGDVQARGTRKACGACHDTVVWDTGVNHGTVGPQLDDTSCGDSACHTPASVVIDHVDPRDSATSNPGLIVTITGVEGGSGTAGGLMPGDTMTVHFTVTDGSGTQLDNDGSEPVITELVLAGPLEHSQTVMSLGDVFLAATYDATNGEYDFTATSPIPDVYPAQAYDTADLGLAEGDMVGEPLDAGTYSLVLIGHRTVDGRGTPPEVLNFPAADQLLVTVGAATLTSRTVVTDEKCSTCHNRIWSHGSSRSNVFTCPACHTAGAEDPLSPTTGPTGVTLEFSSLMHKLHAGSYSANPLIVQDLDGEGNITEVDFSYVRYPRFDGRTGACTACHEGDSAQATTTRVCEDCHNGTTSAAHYAEFTPSGVEDCTRCHDPGGADSIDEVHNVHKGLQP